MKTKKRLLGIFVVAFAMFLGLTVGIAFSSSSSSNTAYAIKSNHTNYLTFSSADEFSLAMTNNDIWSFSLAYSTDKTTWTELETTSVVEAVLDGSMYKIYVCSEGVNTVIDESFVFSGEAIRTNKSGIACSGNVMSLLNSDDLDSATMGDNAFKSLFAYCNALIEAPELPATALSKACYQNMFAQCWRLTEAPSLPASSVSKGAYAHMFEGCRNLRNVGSLEATSVCENSFDSMFFGCESLVSVPWDLEATTLTYDSYLQMFRGCRALVSAPTIKATTLNGTSCLSGMFYGCESLTEVQASLYPTSIPMHGYKEMFSHCSSLVTAPALPATTVGEGAYQDMFSHCSSLVTAPTLNATNISDYSYSGMFDTCYSLVNFQDTLPALTVGEYSYSQMFYDCRSLTKAPDIKATTLGSGCFQEMFSCCINLVEAQATLPATTLQYACYEDMFSQCTRLKKGPNLPAITAEMLCYSSMFWGCESLEEIPTIGITSLAVECFCSMFLGCPLVQIQTTQDAEHATPFCLNIPSSTEPDDWNDRMFGDEITFARNTTYYYGTGTKYNITIDSDFYIVDIAKTASAGQEVDFELTAFDSKIPFKPGKFFDRLVVSIAIYKTGDKTTTYELIEEYSGGYKFTQPECDVTIEVKSVESTDFVINKYVEGKQINLYSDYTTYYDVRAYFFNLFGDFTQGNGKMYVTFYSEDGVESYLTYSEFDSNNKYYIVSNSNYVELESYSDIALAMREEEEIYLGQDIADSMIIIYAKHGDLYSAIYYDNQIVGIDLVEELEDKTMQQLQAKCSNIYFFGYYSYGVTNVTTDTNGTVAIDKENASVSDVVEISVTPSAGYELDTIKVYKADELTVTVAVVDCKFTMPAYDVKVEVTFKMINYTISNATTDTNGSITFDKNSATMGEEVTITVTPNIGYELDKLSVYKKGEENTKLAVNENKFINPAYEVEVKVTFKLKEFTVTFVNDTQSSITVKYGEKLAMPDGIPSKEGYNFVGWATSNGEIYDFETIITGDITLTAKWEEIKAEEKTEEKTEEVTKKSPVGAIIGITLGVIVVLFGVYIAGYVLFTKGKLTGKLFEIVYKTTEIVPKTAISFAKKAWVWIKKTSIKFVNWIKGLFKK